MFRDEEAARAERQREDDAQWASARGVIVAAIHAIGNKDLSYELGIEPGYLSEAIKQTNRKDIRGCWLPAILRLAPSMHREAILAALAKPVGFQVTPRKLRTAEEENVATRRILGRLAPGVLDLLDKELDQ